MSELIHMMREGIRWETPTIVMCLMISFLLRSAHPDSLVKPAMTFAMRPFKSLYSGVFCLRPDTQISYSASFCRDQLELCGGDRYSKEPFHWQLWIAGWMACGTSRVERRTPTSRHVVMSLDSMS